jgi:hypothetical protein
MTMRGVRRAVPLLALLTASCGFFSDAEPMPDTLRKAGEYPASILLPGDHAVVCVLASYEDSDEMLPRLLKNAGIRLQPKVVQTYVSEHEFEFVGMRADGVGTKTRTYLAEERLEDGKWDGMDFEGRRCFEVAKDRVRVTRKQFPNGDQHSYITAVDQPAP